MKNKILLNFEILFISLLSLSFSLSIFSCSKDDSMDTTMEAMDQTAEDSLFSQFVLYNYPMKIFIPKEYEENKNLPVVYLLDGLLADPIDNIVFFDEVVGSMRQIGLKAILVAVGDKTGVDREIDYLSQGCLGTEQGFSNFYNFIHEELVPYIDAKYENDQSRRTLIGFSHGGNFAYNAFFRETQDDLHFYGYISVDPSQCDVSTMEMHLDNMNLSDDTVIKLHLSETQFDAETLYNLIIERDFPWLFVDFQPYPNEDHLSITRPSIQKGLQFIYGL